MNFLIPCENTTVLHHFDILLCGFTFFYIGVMTLVLFSPFIGNTGQFMWLCFIEESVEWIGDR